LSSDKNLNTFLRIIYRFVLLYCFLGFFSFVKAGDITGIHISSDTIANAGSRKQEAGSRMINAESGTGIQFSSDTVPRVETPKKRSNRKFWKISRLLR
jgi:hypothetical protein